MSSQKNSGSKSQLKKRSKKDFLDLMITPRPGMVLPGTNALYVYSESYQPLEKLLSKYNQDLGLTDHEYDEERKSIWHNLKSKFDKVDDTVPFSGLFAQKNKFIANYGKGTIVGTKHHQMRLRRKKKFLDKENYV